MPSISAAWWAPAAKVVQAATLSDAESRPCRTRLARKAIRRKKSPRRAASTTRLQKIAKSLGGTVNGQKANYKVYITKDVNAWAMANGCIRVYSGLMDMMTDDSAGRGGPRNRPRGARPQQEGRADGLHRIGRARPPARPVAATVAALNSSQLGDLTEKFINAQFSQSQESAADDYSFDQLQAKKLNTRGLVTAFQKLAELDGGKTI